MTLYREAIQEVQRAIINNDLMKAKELLGKHVTACHHAEGELLRVIRKLQCYQEHLIFAHELLKSDPPYKEDIDNELAQALSFLIIAEKNIKELIQQNKLSIGI